MAVAVPSVIPCARSWPSSVTSICWEAHWSVSGRGVDVFYEGLQLCYWRMVECADPGENRYLWRSKTYGCWDNVRRSVGGDWSGLKLALSGAAGNNCP